MPNKENETGCFDLHRAHLLAQESASAYRHTTTAIPSGSLAVISKGPVLGFVTKSGRDVVLAFRGTVGLQNEWDQSRLQWLGNLKFGQTAALGGRVHRGFLEALDLVWDNVRQQVGEAVQPGDNLWLTGHSLGGALATLAAARLASESGVPSVVYSFGAPRIGDAAFAAAFRPTLYRVENANDIVCHLPPPPAIMTVVRPLLEHMNSQNWQWSVPADVSYEDVGQLVFIDWAGELKIDSSATARSAIAAARFYRLVRMAFITIDRVSLIVDHSLGRYIDQLGNAPKLMGS